MNLIRPALDLKKREIDGENLLSRLLELDRDEQVIISAKVDALYEVEMLKKLKESIRTETT